MTTTKHKLKVFLGDPSDKIVGKLTSPEVSYEFMEYVFTYLDQFGEDELLKMDELRQNYMKQEINL